MADQTIKITDMPDAGSREAVAFGIAKFIWESEWTSSRQFDRTAFLNLYIDCLEATLRQRPK